ncbi:MAG: hypothetical protein QXS91_02640 [Candidatus Anstonellales archaeon]
MEDISFTYKLLPLRIVKGKDNTLDIIVKVENRSDKEKLVSIEALIKSPGILGFDPTLSNKKAIAKLGLIKPLSKKEVPIRVYASPNTESKNYEIELYLIEHFQDYTKVMHAYKRKIDVMVV